MIDARERGLWLLDLDHEDLDRDAVTVRPMTSTALWMLLSQCAADLSVA